MKVKEFENFGWNFKHFIDKKRIELRKDIPCGRAVVTIAKPSGMPSSKDFMWRFTNYRKLDEYLVMIGQNSTTLWRFDDLDNLRLAIKKAIVLLELVEKIA